MKRHLIFSLLLLFFNCKQDVIDIQLLNGYWEIEKVVLENGESKDYQINEVIDQFTITEELKGSRVKVRALFDGSFITVTEEEELTLENTNDHWVIYYKTPFSSWTETIKKLDETHLELLNEEHRTYIYKRHTAIQTP